MSCASRMALSLTYLRLMRPVLVAQVAHCCIRDSSSGTIHKGSGRRNGVSSTYTVGNIWG